MTGAGSASRYAASGLAGVPGGLISSVAAFSSFGSGVTNTTAPGTVADWNPLTVPAIEASGVSSSEVLAWPPRGICTWVTPSSCSFAVTRTL